MIRLAVFRVRARAQGDRAQRHSRKGLLLAGLIFGSAAAGSPARHLCRDTEVTFAAHHEHARLVIDRMRGVEAAELIAPGWFRSPGTPLDLRAGGGTVATLRLIGPGAVEVRARDRGEAPASGRVEPSWENGAIRLSLRTADGQTFETGFFERVSAGAAPGRLSRVAESILDVTYQAVLRDPGGTSVGWMRVEVDPSGTPGRSYEGVLPTVVTLELAAAATLALDTEIDWIEDHSLDVYRGS